MRLRVAIYVLCNDRATGGKSLNNWESCVLVQGKSATFCPGGRGRGHFVRAAGAMTYTLFDVLSLLGSFDHRLLEIVGLSLCVSLLVLPLVAAVTRQIVKDAWRDYAFEDAGNCPGRARARWTARSGSRTPLAPDRGWLLRGRSRQA